MKHFQQKSENVNVALEYIRRTKRYAYILQQIEGKLRHSTNKHIRQMSFCVVLCDRPTPVAYLALGQVPPPFKFTHLFFGLFLNAIRQI